jgi:Putative peptidoglycan binding domain
MSDFGYGGFHHRHHRHHRHPWDIPPPLDLDPIASAMDVDPDMGCDPYTPGFRVFGAEPDAAARDAAVRSIQTWASIPADGLMGPATIRAIKSFQQMTGIPVTGSMNAQTLSAAHLMFQSLDVAGDDDTDDGTTDDGPADDGSGGQGGVLDATTQVAKGVADVIAPSAPPEAYMPPPVYYAPPAHHRHHHHHPRFVEPRAPLSRWELERIEHERLRRLAFERGRRRFYGEPNIGLDLFPPINSNPAFRFGPNGYRPRGPQHFGHPHHGHGGMMHHGHGHGHGHHSHHPQGGGQGQLPPGSYQASCEQCTYDGQMLSCQCRDTSQNLQPTSMQTDAMGTGGISNHNGQLVQAQS